METSEIDISPLRRAVQRLEEGLMLMAADPRNTLLRDGVIQRFEFSYELSHRMLRRYLESAAPDPEEIRGLSFQDLIRAATERGVVRSPWPIWRRFRQARTDTSHTYDEGKAIEVLGVIPDFIDEAQALIGLLEQRLGRA